MNGNESIVYFIIMTLIFIGVATIICSSNRKIYNPKKDPPQHKPIMKYITKLSCETVLIRFRQESYSLFEYSFKKDTNDFYILTVKMNLFYPSYAFGKAKYKVRVTSETEGSAIWLIMTSCDYEYAKDAFAWEMREFLWKKLEAVRVE